MLFFFARLQTAATGPQSQPIGTDLIGKKMALSACQKATTPCDTAALLFVYIYSHFNWFSGFLKSASG